MCGTGHTLWDDLLKCGFNNKKWKQNFDIITVNRALSDFPAFVDHCYSNHADKLFWWAGARDEAHTHKDKTKGNGKTLLHSNQEHNKVIKWTLPGNGTSGLNAVMLGLYLGYSEIKVCGIPIDNGPHYYDPPYFSWVNFNNPRFDEDLKEKGILEASMNDGILRPWVKFLERFKDIVEPMSGNPREIWEKITN